MDGVIPSFPIEMAERAIINGIIEIRKNGGKPHDDFLRAVRDGRKFHEAGLTPVYIFDPQLGEIYVTSTANMDNTLN